MAWEDVNNRLEKELLFDTFEDAVIFVDKITPLANEKEHHPDILIHSYNKVKVMLTTHDEGKVTEKDHEMAGLIDGID
jgi:4a-hydroxytetrahydrobiopterin dehydratase